MLHKKRVLSASYYAMRRRLRIALRLQARNRPPPVLGQPVEAIIARHSTIARAALQNLPRGVDLAGKSACEVGAGDCLAAVGLFLGLGARQVHVVEISDPVVNEKQIDVLNQLRAQGLPIDTSIIKPKPTPQLDTTRVKFHKGYMEDFREDAAVDFIFSFSVMEHVEDLEGFYRECNRILKPGAYMVHIVDLGGHGVFEDPLPPLDFQTYADWLHDWMFPKYHRPTRRFFEEHKAAVKRHGFEIVEARPTRTASEDYLNEIWPKLRKQACERSRAEIGVIEFALIARKTA